MFGPGDNVEERGQPKSGTVVVRLQLVLWYVHLYFCSGFDGYVPVEPEIESENIGTESTGLDLNRENERRRQEQERQEQERRKQEEESRKQEEEEENRRRQQERIDEEERLRKDRFNELESENGDDEIIVTTPAETTQRPTPTRRRPIQENKPEPICKLPVEPEVDVDFDAGYRFGTTTDSRIEFTQIPTKIKRSYDISLQFKTTSADGVLFYAADGRHTDFIALYLQEGKVS